MRASKALRWCRVVRFPAVLGDAQIAICLRSWGFFNFYSPPPTEALRGSLFFGSRRGQGLLRRTRDAPAGPSSSRRPGHRRLEHASHTRTWWRALCSCASWLCTQRAASSNRIFARALPGFPVSTEHLPRPEVVLQAQGGMSPPSPTQLSASVGAAAARGARYWPESTPRAHASSVTQYPSLS